MGFWYLWEKNKINLHEKTIWAIFLQFVEVNFTLSEIQTLNVLIKIELLHIIAFYGFNFQEFYDFKA